MSASRRLDPLPFSQEIFAESIGNKCYPLLICLYEEQIDRSACPFHWETFGAMTFTTDFHLFVRLALNIHRISKRWTPWLLQSTT